MRFTRVSASVKTAFAFFLVWRQSTCVSHACLHLLRRLLRFSSYCVTMHAFHTRVCIGIDDYCIFLGMALQCMCFTRVFASVKTTSSFSLVWRYNACVSHACLQILRQFSRFLWCGVTLHASHSFVCIYLDGLCVFLRIALQFMRFTRVSASVKTTSAFSLVWCYNACISHACLHLLRRPLRFSWYGVSTHAFHMRVCIG